MKQAHSFPALPKKITIRPISITDARPYFEAIQDMGIRKSIRGIPDVVNFQDVEKQVNRSFGHEYVISINDEYAGQIGFQKLADCIEVGFFIIPRFRNEGIATEALKQFLEMYKDVKVVAARPINPASVKVLMKNGFTELKNGVWTR